MKLFKVYMTEGHVRHEELVLANSKKEALEWYDDNGKYPRNIFEKSGVSEVDEISGKRFEIKILD